MYQTGNSQNKLGLRKDPRELRQELLQQFYEVALERYGRGSEQARSFAEFLTDRFCPPPLTEAPLNEAEVAEVL